MEEKRSVRHEVFAFADGSPPLWGYKNRMNPAATAIGRTVCIRYATLLSSCWVHQSNWIGDTSERSELVECLPAAVEVLCTSSKRLLYMRAHHMQKRMAQQDSPRCHPFVLLYESNPLRDLTFLTAAIIAQVLFFH